MALQISVFRGNQQNHENDKSHEMGFLRTTLDQDPPLSARAKAHTLASPDFRPPSYCDYARVTQEKGLVPQEQLLFVSHVSVCR